MTQLIARGPSTFRVKLRPGLVGPANELAVGTVTTGAPGSDAAVEITGAAPSQVINFTIPTGPVGETGPQGDTGPTGAKGDPGEKGDPGDSPVETSQSDAEAGTGATGQMTARRVAQHVAASIDTGAIAKAIGAKFVEHYGAIGDGTSHPLSERFGTLGAAQAVYPHATSLTDEIDWAAIMLAINDDGALLSQRTYYLGSNRLTDQDGDFVLLGPPRTAYHDWGNGGIDNRARSGAFLHYTGTAASAIRPNTDAATRIALADFAVRVPTTLAAPAIQIDGVKWFGTGASDKNAQLKIGYIAGFTTRTSNGFGENALISLECTSLTEYRAFYGASIDHVYGYGFKDVIKAEVVTPTDTSGGRSNWINGNSFRNVYGYQCYRLYNLIGGVGDSCIQNNVFENGSNQYGVDGAGVAATGYAVRMDGNVARNTFIAVNGFDGATSAWSVLNPPNVSNKQTWNTAVNCLAVPLATQALYIYGPALHTFTPELRINNSATGITWSSPLEARLSVQGDQITVQISGTMTSKGVSTGAVTINGLPVSSGASGNYTFPMLGHNAFFATGTLTPGARLPAGGAYLEFVKGNPADPTYVSNITNADLTGGGQFNLSFTYLR